MRPAFGAPVRLMLFLAIPGILTFGCRHSSQPDVATFPQVSLEAQATQLQQSRPELLALTHWPSAPWPEEAIQVRATLDRLPQGAAVFAVWNGVAGTIAGRQNRIPLTSDTQWGESVYAGVLTKGLSEGDRLNYHIEIESPAGTFKSHLQPLVVSPAGSEWRGMWVNSWSDALFTPEQCRKLVEDTRRANLNAIVIQIRRRGDAFYDSALEPKNSSIRPPEFDPLAEVIRLARDTSGGKQRIEVHGWFVIYPVGRGSAPDTVPPHPTKAHPDWATLRRNGQPLQGEIIFDPGHPGVLQHTVDVIADCVRKYDLDGVNYDYVRYLESDRTPKPEAIAQFRRDQGLASDAEVDTRGETWNNWTRQQPDGTVWDVLDTGYNPVALARFNQFTGQPANRVPERLDPVWMQWRREQVTNFVRKAYATISAIRPQCNVSADSTGWGAIDDGWATSAPMTNVYQDWVSWMRKHIVDSNTHMGYKREGVEAQARDFRQWSRFMIDTDGGRFTLVGIGTFVNPPEDTRAQVEFTRSLRAPGHLFYSYQGAFPRGVEMTRDQWLDWYRENVNPRTAEPPVLAWKKFPTTGILCGTLPGTDGARIFLLDAQGQLPRTLIGTEIETRTDSTGFFAFTKVPPGRWAAATLQADGTMRISPPREVAPGAVVDAFAQ